MCPRPAFPLIARERAVRPAAPKPLLSIADVQRKIRAVPDAGMRAVLRATLKASMIHNPESLQELGNTMGEVMISIEETCRRLNLSESTVRRLINLGPKQGIIAVYQGRALLIPVKALEVYMRRLVREQHGITDIDTY